MYTQGFIGGSEEQLGLHWWLSSCRTIRARNPSISFSKRTVVQKPFFGWNLVFRRNSRADEKTEPEKKHISPPFPEKLPFDEGTLGLSSFGPSALRRPSALRAAEAPDSELDGAVLLPRKLGIRRRSPLDRPTCSPFTTKTTL